jgi:hypothetical protein
MDLNVTLMYGRGVQFMGGYHCQSQKKNMSGARDPKNVLENFGVEILNNLNCVKIFVRNISL